MGHQIRMDVQMPHLAWFLKCIEAGKAAGIAEPDTETKIYTNFVR